MSILLFNYLLVFTVIICKALYISTPLIKSLSVRKNIEIFSVSIQIESLFFVLNKKKIDLFSILIIILIGILSIIIANMNYFDFIIDILNNMQQNTYCAGVPKLVELAHNEIYPDLLFIKYKTLLKYNFSYLDRNKEFYIGRSTIIELHNICAELNLIYCQNIDILKTILNIEQLLVHKTEEEIQTMLKRFYDENLFEKENLRLINTKLGIPLYLDLYYKTYIPFFFEYEYPFNKDIVITKICPLLSTELPKNVNYFNLSLSINDKKDLICLKSNLTVEAETLKNGKAEVVKITDREILNSKLINRHVVISEVKSDTGELVKVKDLECVCETPNSQKKPNILSGGVGIIESYFYYFECISKTESLLNYSNSKLKELIINLKNEEVVVNEFKSYEKNLNFLDFYKSRIIENKKIPDPRLLFEKNEIPIDPNTCLKFNKIDKIFIKQLNKNASMLRDIHNQQSGMQINYQKLIKIIENPDKDIQQYLNSNIKDRILRASEGDFSLKNLKRLRS